MAGRPTGHRTPMPDEDPLERRHDKPMHGERRPQLPALLAVLGLIVGVVLLVAVITLVRYTT